MRLGLLCLLGLTSPLAGQVTHMLLIQGIAGDEEYRRTFQEWSATMLDAAERQGLGPDQVTYLTERPDADARADARSTKVEVEKAFAALAERMGRDDMLFVLLVGHGSGSGADSRFNLPGPDLTAPEYAGLLGAFPTQRVVFVNTAPASGDFVPVLSGPNRTIITATKTGFERNDAIFGGFFVRAYAEDGADVDKDDRVSVLEAFTYAVKEVRRAYDEEGKLLTEHAVLDDNADGEGSVEPGPDGPDGGVARFAFLGGGALAVSATVTDSVLARLYREKAAIEGQLEALRGRKDTMAVDAYDAALEEILVELALKNREIREREEGTP